MIDSMHRLVELKSFDNKASDPVHISLCTVTQQVCMQTLHGSLLYISTVASLCSAMQGLSEEAPEVHSLEYAYFMTGGSPKGLRLHRRSLVAGQCSAEVMNGMLNRYQYMLGSNTAQQKMSADSIST